MNMTPPILEPIGGLPTTDNLEGKVDTLTKLLAYIADFVTFIFDFVKGLFELIGDAIEGLFNLISTLGNFVASYGIFSDFFPPFAWSIIGSLVSFAVAFFLWKIIADTVG